MLESCTVCSQNKGGNSYGEILQDCCSLLCSGCCKLSLEHTVTASPLHSALSFTVCKYNNGLVQAMCELRQGAIWERGDVPVGILLTVFVPYRRVWRDLPGLPEAAQQAGAAGGHPDTAGWLFCQAAALLPGQGVHHGSVRPHQRHPAGGSHHQR